MSRRILAGNCQGQGVYITKDLGGQLSGCDHLAYVRKGALVTSNENTIVPQWAVGLRNRRITVMP